LQLRTRELFDDAKKLEINLEGAGALIAGPPK